MLVLARDELTGNSGKLTTIIVLSFTLAACVNLAHAEAADGAEESNPDATPTSEPMEQPGGQSAAEMAQKLSNPLAAMISLPMQLNYDQNFEAQEGGDRFLLLVTVGAGLHDATQDGSCIGHPSSPEFE